ncbi:MAG: phosphate transport system permease protein PstA [Gemmatales bacterium]|nr:MAG: phosphate transport system permease protein PstA [Gemmatales bacterium]
MSLATAKHDVARKRPPRRIKARTSLLAHGEHMVWLTGGALVLAFVMIIGLLVLVFWQGGMTFWPKPIYEVQDVHGKWFLGEWSRSESFRPERHAFANLAGDAAIRAKTLVEKNDGIARRRLLRTGNRELTKRPFVWINDFEVEQEKKPEWALIFERVQWGNFYGFPVAFLVDGKVVAEKPAEIWEKFQEHHDEVRQRLEKRQELEKDGLGTLRKKENAARLAVRRAEIRFGKHSDAFESAQNHYRLTRQSCEQETERINDEIARLNAENARFQIKMRTAEGETPTISLADIVRAYPANQLDWSDKFAIYLSRWWEFLSDKPREANQEGGVYPAIWGTVAMTLLMTLIVVPFGVLAALYLREYAKSGPIISAVRVSIGNLAGVPSIVFGVFGLGFFCYLVGGHIDQTFYPERLPQPTFGTGGWGWASLTLALLTLPVVIVSTEEALAAVPSSMREGSYACGASKWQTIRRIVLPRAMPGIMTGMILAMARGAGEVAPLMLVGAVKMAPEVPIEGEFPYIQHSFMHLGFHIFDVGFQSPDSEASRPMVYTTTMLLIGIVATLNLLAIWLRARLRRHFQVSQF